MKKNVKLKRITKSHKCTQPICTYNNYNNSKPFFLRKTRKVNLQKISIDMKPKKTEFSSVIQFRIPLRKYY